MGSRRDAPNLRNYSVTREQWDKMLAAYRQRPTIKTVMAAGGVGKRIARRAVMEGWPDMSLPPFVELLSSGTSVHKEMAVARESWEEAAITRGEAARQAAEEAMAARITMKSALLAAQLAQAQAAKLLKKFDNGEVDLPEEITPKVVFSIVRALECSSNVVQKAIQVEQAQMGPAQNVLGVVITELLERCNDSELEIIVRTGEMPGRILDQRKRIIQMMEAGDTAAERRALEGTAMDEVPAQEALQDAQEAPQEAVEEPDEDADGDREEDAPEDEGGALYPPALVGLG